MTEIYDARSAVIKCTCGHLLRFHIERGVLGCCNHYRCDCDAWNFDAMASDAEYISEPPLEEWAKK